MGHFSVEIIASPGQLSAKINTGTARFSVDPRTAVLDLDCKAHKLNNLYLADASFFPS